MTTSSAGHTPRIDGNTQVILHLGWPTHSFKSPLIYNPYFAAHGINVAVVPLACTADELGSLLPPLLRLRNVRGALITMPLKVAVVDLLDETSTAVKVAGACNAVRCDAQGRLVGEQFDGEGFVRGVARKGLPVAGARVLVVGSGGVGCAIAASLAGAGVAELLLSDADPARAEALQHRLARHHPGLLTQIGSADPEGMDLVVNAHRWACTRMTRCRSTWRACHRPPSSARWCCSHRHAPARGVHRPRLPHPDRAGHAVRADSCLPRVLRIAEHQP